MWVPMTEHRDVFENVRRGMIPAHIYNDDELFALEKERLFSRAWMFVAHESEIPQDGDYVVRRVLDDSFIITRDSAGEVRAMFNMCLHRGMQVCRAEMGNASNFRCPYHGWSYRNDGRLTGLPFHREAYGGDEGFREGRPNPAARTEFRELQRSAVHQHGPSTPSRSRISSATSGSIWTSTPNRAPTAWNCGDRSAGGSRRTGRSAPRISPATCTTRRTRTRRSSTSACSASRRPKSARTAPPTGRTAAAEPPTSFRRAASTSGCATSAIPTR